MKNVIALALKRDNVVASTQFAVLVGIAVVAPFFGNQFVTGPIVNATLFVSTILLGTQAGIMVGLMPSVIALSVGTLPAPLAPMIPYIMLSNTILVIVFSLLSKKYWTAIFSSSILKFVFLYLMSLIVVGFMPNKELAQSVAFMMSWPQLVTALAGGVLAYSFLKYKKRAAL
ncbi:iron hydrogenase [bacterium]|nr:iron hydrogenase [bacterium]